MKYLFLPLVLFIISSSLLFSTDLMPKDTFPELDIIKQDRVDTVSIFNYDTGEEVVRAVKNTALYIEIMDSTAAFDYSNYSETISIRRDSIDLYEFYRRFGSERCKKIESYLSELDLWDSVELDTMHIFDAETYEETVSVSPRRVDCYSFCWGNYSFSADHTIRIETLRNLLKSKIMISGLMDKEECKKVESFSCRVVAVPVGQPSSLYRVNQKRADFSRIKLTKYPMMSGGRILIEDIKVNGERVLDAIVLRVE